MRPCAQGQKQTHTHKRKNTHKHIPSGVKTVVNMFKSSLLMSILEFALALCIISFRPTPIWAPPEGPCDIQGHGGVVRETLRPEKHMITSVLSSREDRRPNFFDLPPPPPRGEYKTEVSKHQAIHGLPLWHKPKNLYFRCSETFRHSLCKKICLCVSV